MISTATNTIIDTIPVRGLPFNVTFAPNGRLVVVTSGDLIDATTNTVVGRIKVGIDFAFTADSARIYVANGCSGPQRRGLLELVDVATGAIVRTVLTSGSPNALALSPDGARLYVELFNDGAVAVVDTATNRVLDRFGVADQAHQPSLRGIAVSGTAPPPGSPGQRFEPRPFSANLCDL